MGNNKKPQQDRSHQVIGEDVTFGKDCQIGSRVVIENEVRIGDHVTIEEGCFIGEGSKIGDNSYIGNRCTLREHTWIGRNTVIEAGVVLGSDGFGFAQRADGTQFKIPQVGIVEIGDDCRIGSLATIDRATLGKTQLAEGVCIDSLVMIGHNVKIGASSSLKPLSGVSGSTRIGADVSIGGHAGLVGHLKIEDGCVIEAGCGVTKSLPKDSHIKGVFPAMPPEQFDHQQGMINDLPRLVERLEAIERITSQAAGSQQIIENNPGH